MADLTAPTLSAHEHDPRSAYAKIANDAMPNLIKTCGNLDICFRAFSQRSPHLRRPPRSPRPANGLSSNSPLEPPKLAAATKFGQPAFCRFTCKWAAILLLADDSVNAAFVRIDHNSAIAIFTPILPS
jgi:hypothetical protein